nr:dirigent protein 2 [Phryma leptostachya]
MATRTQVAAALFLCLLISSVTAYKRKPRPHRPCKQYVFYFHDVLFNGHNFHNATAAIVGSPQWANKTTVAIPNNFGDVVVFDDPITLDNNFHSPPVGRAQGMYIYDQWTPYGAWLGFSFLFNSTDYVGTLNFAGADPLLNKTRDISVIGGTGDFFMARGVATLSTDSFEQVVYFRLRVDINLYECW